MSVDFAWAFSLLTPAEEEELLPHFQLAAESTRLNPEAVEAYEDWRDDPESISPEDESSEDFNDAFRSESLDELGHLLILKNPKLRFRMNETNTTVIMLGGIPPTAVLAYALGPERTLRLPGLLTRSIVRAASVPSIARDVKGAFRFEEDEKREVRQRGEAWAELSTTGPGDVDAILKALPSALARAEKEKKGLAVVSFRMP